MPCAFFVLTLYLLISSVQGQFHQKQDTRCTLRLRMFVSLKKALDMKVHWISLQETEDVIHALNSCDIPVTERRERNCASVSFRHEEKKEGRG